MVLELRAKNKLRYCLIIRFSLIYLRNLHMYKFFVCFQYKMLVYNYIWNRAIRFNAFQNNIYSSPDIQKAFRLRRITAQFVRCHCLVFLLSK